MSNSLSILLLIIFIPALLGCALPSAIYLSRLSVPTNEAIDKNTCYDYKDISLDYYKTDASIYWLRDPVDGSSSRCYMVGHGAISQVPDNIFDAIACCDGYGIRPAMTVDLTSDCIKFSE